MDLEGFQRILVVCGKEDDQRHAIFGQTPSDIKPAPNPGIRLSNDVKGDLVWQDWSDICHGEATQATLY